MRLKTASSRLVRVRGQVPRATVGEDRERSEGAAFLCPDRSALMTIRANSPGQGVGDPVVGSDYLNVTRTIFTE